MPLNFDRVYTPGLWTGEQLRAECEVDGTDSITLVISGVEERPFKDISGVEWVLLFEGQPGLRLKAGNWRATQVLRKHFGSDGRKWVGQSVVLRPRPVDWIDRQTGEHKSGTSIDIEPVLPAIEVAVESLPEALDDEIPF